MLNDHTHYLHAVKTKSYIQSIDKTFVVKELNTFINAICIYMYIFIFYKTAVNLVYLIIISIDIYVAVCEGMYLQVIKLIGAAICSM